MSIYVLMPHRTIGLSRVFIHVTPSPVICYWRYLYTKRCHMPFKGYHTQRFRLFSHLSPMTSSFNIYIPTSLGHAAGGVVG